MKNKIVVKKQDFLTCVNETYKNDSDEYILALSNALMLIYEKRTIGGVNFEDYKGLIQI